MVNSSFMKRMAVISCLASNKVKKRVGNVQVGEGDVYDIDGNELNKHNNRDFGGTMIQMVAVGVGSAILVSW